MARLYTYGESPVKTVRAPKDPFMAAGYVAGMPGVNAAVHARAIIGATVATAVLEAHVSDQDRSSHPKINLRKGDRTDWHIEMTVEVGDGDDGTDNAALEAAYSIEYGRGSYRDRFNRRQPATGGVGALTIALAAMGF